MSRRRRQFLLSLVASVAPLPRLASALPIPVDRDRTAPGETLRRYLDTLIPADETPSASALGVDREVMDIARRLPEYLQLLDLGLAWLDTAARARGAASFAAATDEHRIAIVREAQEARPGTLPRRLFDRVRSDAVRLYYAHPASWSALDYGGPPQPVGFPDFERGPAVRR